MQSKTAERFRAAFEQASEEAMDLTVDMIQNRAIAEESVREIQARNLATFRRFFAELTEEDILNAK